jgi:hypothetical protein
MAQAGNNLAIKREIVTAGVRRCAKVSDAMHAVAVASRIMADEVDALEEELLRLFDLLDHGDGHDRR